MDFDLSELEDEKQERGEKPRSRSLGKELEKLKVQATSSPAGRKEKGKSKERTSGLKKAANLSGLGKPKKRDESPPEVASFERKRKKKRDKSSEEVQKPVQGKKWFGKRTKDPKRKPKRSKRSEDRVETEAASEEEAERKPKKKKVEKSKAKKPPDRGPYGVGQAMDFDDEEDSESNSDGEEDPIFRRGVSDKRSQQLRLMEYALERPGRLTSRLLQKMQTLLSREVGTPFLNQAGTSNLTPPVATSYLQTVLVPTHKEKLGVRLLREMRTLAAALDEVAKGNPEAAGDFLSQRLKALELQLTDGGWMRAQFLELIGPEGPGLSERPEQYMAAREQAAEAKMKQLVGGQQRPWPNQEGKGKGNQKGKTQGKKGGKKGWNQN